MTSRTTEEKQALEYLNETLKRRLQKLRFYVDTGYHAIAVGAYVAHADLAESILETVDVFSAAVKQAPSAKDVEALKDRAEKAEASLVRAREDMAQARDNWCEMKERAEKAEAQANANASMLQKRTAEADSHLGWGQAMMQERDDARAELKLIQKVRGFEAEMAMKYGEEVAVMKARAEKAERDLINEKHQADKYCRELTRLRQEAETGRCTECPKHIERAVSAEAERTDFMKQAIWDRQRAEKAEAERDRLAKDALVALAGSKVITPAEGYVKSPWCLAHDIVVLRQDRAAEKLRADTAEVEVEILKRQLDQRGIDTVSDCHDLGRRLVRTILDNQDRLRERLVEAWIAETGLHPSESVIVSQVAPLGRYRTWIEAKKKETT